LSHENKEPFDKEPLILNFIFLFFTFQLLLNIAFMPPNLTFLWTIFNGSTINGVVYCCYHNNVSVIVAASMGTNHVQLHFIIIADKKVKEGGPQWRD